MVVWPGLAIAGPRTAQEPSLLLYILPQPKWWSEQTKQISEDSEYSELHVAVECHSERLERRIEGTYKRSGCNLRSSSTEGGPSTCVG